MIFCIYINYNNKIREDRYPNPMLNIGPFLRVCKGGSWNPEIPISNGVKSQIQISYSNFCLQVPRIPRSQFHSCFFTIPISTGMKSQIPISNDWNPNIPNCLTHPNSRYKRENSSLCKNLRQ